MDRCSPRVALVLVLALPAGVAALLLSGGEGGEAGPVAAAGERPVAAPATPAAQRPGPEAGGLVAPASEEARVPTPAGRAPATPAAEATGGPALVVVDADGRPVAELEVALVVLDQAGEQQARAVLATDTAGALDTASLTETAAAKGGWEVCAFPNDRAELALVPERFPLARLVPGSGSALRLVATPQASAPFHGRAVDAESGEPLPELGLLLRSWSATLAGPEDPAGWRRTVRLDHGSEQEAWLVTDAEGRFLTGPLPAGELHFEAVGGDDPSARHALPSDASAAPVDVPVRVGPRLLLALDGPPELDATDLVATLWRAPEELIADGELEVDRSPWTRDGPQWLQGWRRSMPVHAGDPAWFRITAEQLVEAPLPTYVLVASRAGRLLGWAFLGDLEDAASRPLPVSLQAYETLEVELSWDGPASTVDRGEAELTLTPVEERLYEAPLAQRSSYAGLDTVPGSTVVRFPFVPRGSYTLRVGATGVEEIERRVSVPAAEPVRIDLGTPVAPAHSPLVLRFVSDSGQALDGEDGRAHLAHCHVLEQAVDTWTNRPVRWQGGVGELRMEAAHGRVYLSPRWNAGGFEIEPDLGYLQHPEETSGLTLRIHDSGPTVHYEVRLLEPTAVGALVFQSGDSSQVWSFCEGGDLEQGVRRLEDGRRAAVVRAGPFAVDSGAHVSFDLEGHLTPEFDETDFAPPDARGVRVLEIVPVPGWSAQVDVEEGTGEDCAGRLEGIVLALDGEPLPPTDRHGYVFATAPQQPERIEVLTPGWELQTRASYTEWGSVLADTGRFTVESGRLTVHLRRR